MSRSEARGRQAGLLEQPHAKGGSGRGLAGGFLIACALLLGGGAPAEQVLLDRTATVTPRGRQLRGFAAPPANWQQPDFDDRSWPELPLVNPSTSTPSPGSPWLTAAASSSTPSPVPDAGIVLAEEATDGGTRAAPTTPPAPPAATPTSTSPTPADPALSPPNALPIGAAGALRAGAIQIFPGAIPAAVTGVTLGAWTAAVPPETPAFPVCAGTLHLRRRFDLDPAAPVPTRLLLRARYSDGLIAWLNGVEVSRRRLPEPAQTQTHTLAIDRGTVEPERLYVAVPAGLLKPQGNVLALEIHGRSLDRCTRIDMELVAVAGPRAVRGPYMERLIDGALDLTVETDVPTRAELRYGRGAALVERDKRLIPASDAPLQTQHRLHVTGLRAGSAYHYQLALVGEDGARVELPLTPFHTPPPPGRPLRMVLYGDSRSGHAVHAQIIQGILAEDPDVVIHTGDVVERGTEEGDWDRFFAVAGPLLARMPVYLTPGNHEYAPKRKGAERLFALFQTMFPPQPPPGTVPFTPSRRAERAMTGLGPELAQVPASGPALGTPMPASTPASAEPAEPPRGYFSLDVSGVHLVSLDSNQLNRPEQLAWLEQDLAQVDKRKARATLVWLHDGPFSANGWHGDSSIAQRELVPILEKHRVSLIVSGHDHNYERGRRGQLSYVVSGGGGAELRPLRCGAPGKRRCKNPPQAFFNEHHYIRCEVLPGALRLCPKRVDGSPLEDCFIVRSPS